MAERRRRQVKSNSPTFATTYEDPGLELAPSTMEEKDTAMERKMDEQAQNMQILMQMIRELKENNVTNRESPRNISEGVNSIRPQVQESAPSTMEEDVSVLKRIIEEQAETMQQMMQMIKELKESNESNSESPSSSSEGVNSTRPQENESNPMVAMKIFLWLFQIWYWLGEILCSVGTNAGAMFNFLKLFKIDLGIDLSEKFDISRKPVGRADFLKIVCFCGVVFLLCFRRSSKSPFSIVIQFYGVAVIYAVGSTLWDLLSDVPPSFQVVFALISGFFLLFGRKMTT